MAPIESHWGPFKAPASVDQPPLHQQWTWKNWVFKVADQPAFAAGQIYATFGQDSRQQSPYSVDLTSYELKFRGRQEIVIQSEYAFCRMDDDEDYLVPQPTVGMLFLPVMRLTMISAYARVSEESHITHMAGAGEIHILEYAAQQILKTIYLTRGPDDEPIKCLLYRGTMRIYRLVGQNMSLGRIDNWEVVPGTQGIRVDISFRDSSVPESYVLHSIDDCEKFGLFLSHDA